MSGLLSDELDLLLAVSLVVILRTFVDVLLTILQPAMDQSGEAVSHGGDGFGGAELAAQASVLRGRMVKNLKRIEKAWFPVSQFSRKAGF